MILNISNPHGLTTCKHMGGHSILPVPLPGYEGALFGVAGAYAKPRDLAKAGVQYYVPLAAIADAAGRHFPGTSYTWRMRDYGCWSVDTLAKRATRLAGLILDGYRVAVACHGGHGRTGTLLAAVGIVLGIPEAVADPVGWIRRVYCSNAVEATEQEEALETLAGFARAQLEQDNL